MNSDLLKSAVDVANKPASAASVGVASIGTGMGAYLELLSPVVGLLAATAGLILSVMLAVKAYYAIRLQKIRIEDLENGNGG
ncbi:MAG: hypothetical protein KAR40_07865 [Candidatus Sabulitectum sp.]|nr:hypothetical protein [Candidatus Sabulitectum sp.]